MDQIVEWAKRATENIVKETKEEAGLDVFVKEVIATEREGNVGICRGELMNFHLVLAGTSDALTLTGISKRSFDSDTEVGAVSKGGPPGYASVPFHTKMARQKHLYKLIDENGLIIGGAILFSDKEHLNVARIFVGPENFRKGYGLLMMQEIEQLFPDAKQFTLDTPIWNIRTNSFYQKLGYKETRRDAEFVYYAKYR